MIDLIEVLQHWYASQCDDVWEHSFGVEITNIDNPGWRVKINGVSSKKAIDLDSDRDDMDWLRVTATETEFTGYGGPGNLKEILTLAMDWLK
ncbi:Imm53 family immunity protein [Ensifer sp. 2YAB10]|uniref:Imm53 family immunity protein n=1 Tax=Ensifer sp. 2YAB10 TaxID=3233021 RepID=UPI003F9158D7